MYKRFTRLKTFKNRSYFIKNDSVFTQILQIIKYLNYLKELFYDFEMFTQ
jgi:hypothetical protein